MNESQQFNLCCPACSAEQPVTVADVRAERTITCKGCGKEIHLKDQGFSEGMDEAIKSAKDAFARISKTFSKR